MKNRAFRLESDILSQLNEMKNPSEWVRNVLREALDREREQKNQQKAA